MNGTENVGSGDKFEVSFYDNGKFTNINIPDSLSVDSVYDMMAIVDEITKSEYYSEELYGTKKHMVAQWLAHNVAHNIATNESLPDAVNNLLKFFSGADDPASSSQKLDIRQNGNMGRRAKLLYDIIELFIP